MSQTLSLKCHTCGHEWQASLDEAQEKRVIYKDDPTERQSRWERYVFKCPVDGTQVVKEIEVEG